MILGGGTASGYAASEFVKHGLNPGDLCVISQEMVRLPATAFTIQFDLSLFLVISGD